MAAKVDDISDEELLLRLYKLKNDDVPKADPDKELLLRLDKLRNDYVPKEIPEAPTDLNVSEVPNSKHQDKVRRPTFVHSVQDDSDCIYY